MEPGAVAKVLQDVFTTTEGEISLLKGDFIQIIKQIDKYWCYGNSVGKVGNFPSDKLIEVETPQLADNEELFVAVADFSGEQDGDLAFRKGEFIVGEEKLDNHWWRGNVDKFRKGVFPDTFTWHLDSSNLKTRKKHGLNLKARVILNLKAQLDEEIDLQQGDVVNIIEETEKGWFRGTCGNRTGIFPASYVTIIDDYPLSLEESSTAHSRNHSSSGYSSHSNSNALSASDSSSNIDSISSSHPSVSLDNLITFSPEKELKALAGSIPSSNNDDVLDDDYFKLNMPSSYIAQSSSATEIFRELQEESMDTLTMLDPLSEAGDSCNVQPYGMTLYPFYAQYANELSFHENEIVNLIRYIDDDWLEGEIDGRKGIFPVNYINIVVDCDKNSKWFSKDRSDEFNPVKISALSFAKVMYSFDAQMNGDLSVKEGDVVMIMKVIDDDWCEVRSKTGSVGLCPSNHLTPHSVSPAESLFRSSSFSVETPANTTSMKAFLDSMCSTKRKYETHDFACKPEEKKVEDLISKNLSVLNISTSVKKIPEEKDFINYKDELIKNHEESSKMADEVFEEKSSNLPIMVDLPVILQPDSLSEPPPYPPPPPPTELPISEPFEDINTSSESSSQVTLRQHENTEDHGSTFARRSAPPVPSPIIRRPVRPPPPARKMSIDHSPHRPAPPVPVPGQTPVRRSIRRLPRQTSAPCFTSEEVSDVETANKLLRSKEQQLQEMQVVCEEIENELENTPEGETRKVELRERETACKRQIQRLKVDIMRYKDRVQNSKILSQDPVLSQKAEEEKKKMSEQRQNVISELVITEKEYVRDLKVTYETFNLHNPRILEDRGIDVKGLFGNILDVMHVAEDLLDSLQRAMKGRADEDQLIGPVFLEHANSIKTVYSEYCTNHDGALALLEKYKDIPEAQGVLDKGMETLKHQVTCFNMGSILIKPVQRLLKYPLILNELIKCTEDCHKDKPELINAVRVFTGMASAINEYKRRKDIVSKYLGDGTSTLARKMAKLNLHSVAKKSSRLGAKLSSTFGLSLAPKDERFLEQERTFHVLERTLRTLIRNVDTLMHHLSDEILFLFNLSEALPTFYQERTKDVDVDEFRTTQRLILSQYWEEFKRNVERRVTAPLTNLLELFSGPSHLIEKRNDKLLDYDNCLSKSDKNRDNRQFQEELTLTKNNYDALNDQLLEELPKLSQLSNEIIFECLSAFVAARKLLSGKITKQYLQLIEVPALAASSGNIMESFSVKHYLICNKLSHISFTSKSLKDPGSRKSLKSSQTPARQLGTDGQKLSQSASQCAFLQGKYPADKLFRIIEDHGATDSLELELSRGHLVGVIKKQDPMGSTNRWFVDDGVAQGFVRSNCLEQAGSLSLPPSPASSTSSYRTSPSGHSRPPSAASNYSTSSKSKLSLSPNVNKAPSAATSPSNKSDNYPPSYEEVTGNSPSHLYDDVPCDERRKNGTREYLSVNTESENEYHIYDEIPANTSYSDTSPDSEFFYSAYDFPGMGPNTLPLKFGQVVIVLQRNDLQGNSEWWMVEDRHGKKGFVPANYLQVYTASVE